MDSLRNFSEKYFFSISAVVIYLGMILFSFKYEMNPYLWFDDAGQFWISQGLNHDSAPLSQAGGLIDVIVNNAGYNLDPGGYGIILHYWSKISTNYVWLRSLSFLFFILSTIVLGYLGYLWTRNINIGIWAGFIPFYIPMIFNNGFALRAYSMEVLGCLVCILAVHFLQNKLSIKRLFCWSVIIAVFLTSRYSFIVVAFVTSLYILYLIYRSDSSNKTKWFMAVVYAMPLFVTIIYIYFAALRFQNPKLDTLDYLPYISSNWKVLIHRSSLRHFFYLFVVVWLSYIFRENEKFQKYKGLVFITVSVNVLFFVFSCFGMHPWDGGCDRCISMITLVIISITALWCELISLVYEKVKIQYILLLFICYQLTAFKSDIKAPWWKNNSEMSLISDFKQLSIDENSKVFVDRWESPCLRYQIEYGSLKGVINYPQNYTFMIYRKHGIGYRNSNDLSRDEWIKKTQPYLNDLYDKYDILIVPELYVVKSENSDKWKSVNGHNKIWIKAQ